MAVQKLTLPKQRGIYKKSLRKALRQARFFSVRNAIGTPIRLRSVGDAGHTEEMLTSVQALQWAKDAPLKLFVVPWRAQGAELKFELLVPWKAPFEPLMCDLVGIDDIVFGTYEMKAM